MLKYLRLESGDGRNCANEDNPSLDAAPSPWGSPSLPIGPKYRAAWTQATPRDEQATAQQTSFKSRCVSFLEIFNVSEIIVFQITP